MPDCQDWRIERAENLESLFGELEDGCGDVDSSLLDDWRLVIGFYSALHYCNAFLEHAGYAKEAFADHSSRHQTLRQSHQPVWDQYRGLKDLAWQVRYRKHRPRDADRKEFEDRLDECIKLCRRRMDLPG